MARETLSMPGRSTEKGLVMGPLLDVSTMLEPNRWVEGSWSAAGAV